MLPAPLTRREFLARAAALGAGAAVARVPGAVAGLASPAVTRSANVVQTVRGPVDAAKLGFTLPHEHVCAGSAGIWQAWPELLGGREAFVRKAVEKLREAKDEGVDTIVDVTPIDVGRDVRLLEEVSRKSGMQIVACTGHWLAPSPTMEARTVEELAEFFQLEIERGLEGTGIKPGVIKVATDRAGATPFLEKALRAAARASKATGVPVTTHSYAVGRGGEQQAQIFESEGLGPARVCIGHCDESDDLDYLTGLARRGYTLGMDHLPSGIPLVPGASLLPWRKRAETIKRLIDAGFVRQVFLSNDWYFGVPLAPTGFMEAAQQRNPDGILFDTRNTIPYLKQLGVTDGDLHTITVDNPRRFFGGEA